MISLIRNMLVLVSRRDRWRVGALIIPMILTSIMEMAGVIMIVPLLRTLFGQEDGVTEWLPSFLSEMAPDDRLFAIMLLFVALQVLKNLAILFMAFSINRFIQRLLVDAIRRMFTYYIHQPYLDHVSRGTPEVLRNILSSTPAAFESLRVLMTMVLEVVLVTGTIVLLILVEPAITISLAASMVIVGVLFYRFSSPFFRHWGERTHACEARMIKAVSEGLGAIKDIRIMRAQPYMIARLHSVSEEWARNLSRSMTASQMPRLFVETTVVIGLLATSLVLLDSRGSMDEVITVMGLFGMAAIRLMPSMNRILTSAATLRERSALLETLGSEVRRHDQLREDEGIDDPSEVPIALQHDIEVRNLSFAFGSSERGEVLHDVSFKIGRGESLAIVGPSGAGKSTLMDIMLGLIGTGSTAVLADGRPISENMRSWHASIGYVPQHIYLLDDTLRRNIAFGLPDEGIDTARLEAAVDKANLREVVASLPEGLETVVGENGARLSGGQRQRVGIGRALYRSPDILMFDEATSSLDGEAEHEIISALHAFAGQITVIIIAHRLSTVRHCSKIVYLRDGRVADIGTFDGLMASNADFRRFAQLTNRPGQEPMVQECKAAVHS